MGRVLHVISGLGAGGAEGMLVRLVDGLSERGFVQHVVSLTDGGKKGSDDLLEILGMSARAQLGWVDPGSPADKAGLKSHDILVRYDNQKLFSPQQLTKLVWADQPGRAGYHRPARDLAGDLEDAVVGKQVRGFRPKPLLDIKAVDPLQVLDGVLGLDLEPGGRLHPRRVRRSARRLRSSGVTTQKCFDCPVRMSIRGTHEASMDCFFRSGRRPVTGVADQM